MTPYSARLGEALGLTPPEIRVLLKGSFLHDAGKLGIPDSILLKPARLDPQEFSVMKTHVDKGTDIVERSSWLREGTEVIGYHHEKFAGGGYPRGLTGQEIPITARIFAGADVFDALTSQRPYKKPLTFEEAMGILGQDSGKYFDPAGFSNMGDRLLKLADRVAEERAFHRAYRTARFVRAALGRDSGVLGAAAFAFDEMKRARGEADAETPGDG